MNVHMCYAILTVAVFESKGDKMNKPIWISTH